MFVIKVTRLKINSRQFKKLHSSIIEQCKIKFICSAWDSPNITNNFKIRSAFRTEIECTINYKKDQEDFGSSFRSKRQQLEKTCAAH